jgi:putative oxidoreductase
VYVGEVLAPLLVIVGFYARVGAAVIVVNMLFAIMLAHRADLFLLTKSGGWALELQGFFLFTALALALIGPGRFGINQR